MPGNMGSDLKQFGPLSVNSFWVRQQINPAVSISVWQHIKLSKKICPWNTPRLLLVHKATEDKKQFNTPVQVRETHAKPTVIAVQGERASWWEALKRFCGHRHPARRSVWPLSGRGGDTHPHNPVTNHCVICVSHLHSRVVTSIGSESYNVAWVDSIIALDISTWRVKLSNIFRY